MDHCRGSVKNCQSICNNIVLYNYSIHNQAEQKSVYNHTTMKHMPIAVIIIVYLLHCPGVIKILHLSPLISTLHVYGEVTPRLESTE